MAFAFQHQPFAPSAPANMSTIFTRPESERVEPEKKEGFLES